MTAVFEAMSAVGAAPWAGTGRQGVDLLHRGRAAGPGRALDLGCGTGDDACELARRGLPVTGVDDVPRSLARARRRVDGAGVQVHLVLGDVADLGALELVPEGAHEGFSAVLDVGCLHGMAPGRQAAVGRGLDAVTERGALLALLAWAPARRPPPLPRGLGREALADALPGWDLQHTEAADPRLVPRWLHRTRPTWFVLERR